jgi:hypothetical protein
LARLVDLSHAEEVAMKFGVTILVVVVLAGCSRDSGPSVPTAPAPPAVAGPSPPTDRSALLWVMVVGEGGGCIEEATIQRISPSGVEEPVRQDTPCGVWDYGGGLLLQDLADGVELTLRGAAPGYLSREGKFLPTPRHMPYRAVFIELQKAQ